MSALVLLAALSLQTPATHAIEGRVTDESGTPVPGVLVTIRGSGIAGPDATLADEDGRFEWTGLAPGRHHIVAEGRGYFTETPHVVLLTQEQPRQQVRVVVTRGAVIAGFVSDEFGDPIANLMVELSRSSRPFRTALTDDRGYYRFWSVPAGRYYASARVDTIDAQRSTLDTLPLATFFPGVPSRARAEPIVVAAGTEVEGVNFAVRFGRYVALSISVNNSSGKPAHDAVVAVASLDGDRADAAIFARAVRPGQFVATKLAPGDYEIAALQRGRPLPEYGLQRISIAGDTDLSIALSTGPVATLSGRVVTDGPAALPPGLAIVTASTHEAFRTRVGSDGRFSVAVPPGRHLVQVQNLPPGWTPLSMHVNGQDEIDRPLMFVGGKSIDRVEIAIGDRLATVTGTIAGASPDDAPLAVLFSPDPTRWSRGTRSILTAVAGLDGRFRIAGVRPGDYLAAAVPAVDSDSLGEEWFLRALVDRALPIRIIAGEDPPATALTLPRR